MDEIITAIDDLRTTIETKRDEQVEGSLPKRLLNFSARNLGHVKRMCIRVKAMLDV